LFLASSDNVGFGRPHLLFCNGGSAGETGTVAVPGNPAATRQNGSAEWAGEPLIRVEACRIKGGLKALREESPKVPPAQFIEVVIS